MKASREQKRYMREWYEQTGFEFMSSDDASADDPQGFIELWERNVEWLRDLATETDAILSQYRNRHGG